MTDTAQQLTLESGTLAYHHTPGSAPGIMFCGGLMSDMEGSKALSLEAHCTAKGQSFTRFDYRGHGQSSGAFRRFVISDWL
ncbi:MAG: alpha/beta hydrolase, partial [Pseudomonadota bacterium]